MTDVHAGEFAVLWGKDGGYEHMMLAYEGNRFWMYDFGLTKLDIRLETSVGQVAAPSGLGHDSLWHVGLTPTVRYWFTPRTGIEYGLGANVFSGTHLGDKNLSTAFQFGSSIGVFHRFADSPWTVGLRFSHYSNADIKRPNPGQDYLQLRVSYAFD
jgi:lipid A 3-O-deacylase